MGELMAIAVINGVAAGVFALLGLFERALEWAEKEGPDDAEGP